MGHVVAGAPQSLRGIAASRLAYAKKGILLTARGALNKICFKQAYSCISIQAVWGSRPRKYLRFFGCIS